MKPFFAGFYGQNGNSVTPTFSCAEQTDNGVSISFEGSEMTVSTAAFTSPHILGYNITVNDGETTWSQRFGVAVTGSTTGIVNVNGNGNVNGNKDFYDLQGRRVAQPSRGLYIQNGRKIVMK